MIFVTVGTHEQPFNRLIECVDELRGEGILREDVIIQTGYSTYKPVYCEWKNFYTYQQMIDHVEKARIVITHGGPSSFIMPLQIGKTPIVVPREKKFGEHINDHQVEFVKEVEQRMGTIIAVSNIDKLKDIILEYNTIVNKMHDKIQSNNIKFNIALEKIVNQMFEGDK